MSCARHLRLCPDYGERAHPAPATGLPHGPGSAWCARTSTPVSFSTPPCSTTSRSPCSASTGSPTASTVLIVEHDLDVVFRLADRVTVLHLGKVLASGEKPVPVEARLDRHRPGEVRRGSAASTSAASGGAERDLPSKIPGLALFSHALSSLRRSTAHGRSSLATARLNGRTSERSSAQAAGPSVM